MPTIATCSVVGHSYGPVELKKNDRGSYAQVRFWTNDKVKGQDEKKFTAWEGFVSGPQAEWLAKDCIKGSLLFVSGTIRLSSWKNKDGVESHRIEFTRINECRLLERADEGGMAETGSPARAAPIKPAAAGATDDSGIPF